MLRLIFQHHRVALAPKRLRVVDRHDLLWQHQFPMRRELLFVYHYATGKYHALPESIDAAVQAKGAKA